MAMNAEALLERLFRAVNEYQLLVGVMLGWLFGRFWEELRKPNIELDIGHEAFWPTNDSVKTKFLHVKARNARRGWLGSLLFSNPTANNARAWVSFYDYESRAEVFRMNGRWVTRREPVDYSTGKVDLAEVLVPPRETIPSGEEASISIAVKDDGIPHCYGFNNESYLHNWRNPEFELSDKKYIARVIVSSEGKEWTKDFVLMNPETSFKNFKLAKGH